MEEDNQPTVPINATMYNYPPADEFMVAINMPAKKKTDLLPCQDRQDCNVLLLAYNIFVYNMGLSYELILNRD